MEDTECACRDGVLRSSLVSDMGIGIGVSHHHFTGASPEDDTHAEGSQDLFLQHQLCFLQTWTVTGPRPVSDRHETSIASTPAEKLTKLPILMTWVYSTLDSGGLNSGKRKAQTEPVTAWIFCRDPPSETLHQLT